MYKYLWFLSFVCSTTVINSRKFEVLYEWSWIDYLWESEAQRTAAIQSGQYNYTKPVIIDVDVWKGRKRKDKNKELKTFITVIRRKGVPASLTTVSNDLGDGGPLLKPYPNWSWTTKNNCDGITSVFRVAIDECDRLWALDTGKIDDESVCPAQLLAFDLTTDRLIKRVKIPKKLSENPVTKHGLFVTPVVETEGHNCKKTHVYMADVTGNALVIYNGTTLWRLESPVYSYQETAANFTIAGETFYLDDGVLGMALSPSLHNHRYLMFRPLASFDMMSVDVSNLHSSYSGPVRYTFVSKALPSQAAAMAFSKSGVLFFGLIQNHTIACWNMHKPIISENIVILDEDTEYYQFISGVKVIPRQTVGRHDQLWITINRYQKLALGSQKFDEINFRVMSHRIDRLIRGTSCDPSSPFEKFLNSAEELGEEIGSYFWDW